MSEGLETMLGPMPLAGLKDWSAGYIDPAVAETLGDAGPYCVVLTFDSRETINEWISELTTKVWCNTPSDVKGETE